MDDIEQPWGDHRLKMNGVYIGCVTVENANIIMKMQRDLHELRHALKKEESVKNAFDSGNPNIL